MIKNFFLSAFLAAVASYTTAPAVASPKEDVCLEGANLFISVAEGRDTTIPETSYKALRMMGFSSDAALSIIKTVYITQSDASPQDIGAGFYSYCMSEPD